MNLVYNQNGNKAIIRTDDSDLVVDNYSQLEEILKVENVQEQLKTYYNIDKSRLKELEQRKLKLYTASAGAMVGAISVSGILTAMSAYNAIDDEFSRSIQMGALALGGAVTLINETVLSRRRELLGLRECINYEQEKIDELETKLSVLVNTSSIVEGNDSVLIDSRKELQQLDDVLNFIFYYGANKRKVQRMYENGEIISFLEKIGIKSFDTIAEIEDYLFREVNNMKMYEDVMVKK